MCGFQGTQKPYTISGDNGERDPPVPIPNTEVKPFSADGTWLGTTWESRTLPDSTKKKPQTMSGAFSLCIPSGSSSRSFSSQRPTLYLVRFPPCAPPVADPAHGGTPGRVGRCREGLQSLEQAKLQRRMCSVSRGRAMRAPTF